MDDKKIKNACKAFVQYFVRDRISFEEVSPRLRREFNLSEAEFVEVLKMYDAPIKAAFDKLRT